MVVSSKIYSGVVVPMISPFLDNLTVDVQSVRKITREFVSAGVAPFIIGSTGEGPSLSAGQKELLIKGVSVEKKDCLLYAGINSNSFSSAIEEAKFLADFGADVLVVTLPYYYPIDEEQMLHFFSELADKLPLPLILYNMPAMVKRSIPLDIADRLSMHPNIVGMKDSERDELRLAESVQLWGKRTDFSFLVGWAAKSAVGLQLGADGIVPSTGNLCPQWYVELYQSVLDGDIERANHLQGITDTVSVLYQHNRDLSHSIPALKVMMEMKGFCSSMVLPPMYPMADHEKKKYIEEVSEKMKQLNLL